MGHRTDALNDGAMNDENCFLVYQFVCRRESECPPASSPLFMPSNLTRLLGPTPLSQTSSSPNVPAGDSDA